MKHFLNPETVSLKVCGVTLQSDAEMLLELGVEAMGVNFWPNSKRFLAPEKAGFCQALSGKILRVGVFVNADKEEVQSLIDADVIDVAQFHGDEDAAYCAHFAELGIPYFRAIGVKDEASIEGLELPNCRALLLDAHAPGVYGGTGQTCDWSIIPTVQKAHPDLPIVLAGGITPSNVSSARALEHIVALDVASGAERAPGLKDRGKVQILLQP